MSEETGHDHGLYITHSLRNIYLFNTDVKAYIELGIP